MKIYKEWKNEIGGQEKVYDNRPASEILFKCRTNNLKLKDRKRFQGEETKCDICDAEKEDLNHFSLWCPELNEERIKCTKLQRPYIENQENIIGDLLFNKSKNQIKYISIAPIKT